MPTPTPTPGLNQQQENALQEVTTILEEAVTSGRCAPMVRTVFTQFLTQARAVIAGPTAAGITAHGTMQEIQARLQGR